MDIDNIIKLPSKTGGGGGTPVYALSVTAACPHFVVSGMHEGQWVELAHLETLNDAMGWLMLRAGGPLMFDANGVRV